MRCTVHELASKRELNPQRHTDHPAFSLQIVVYHGMQRCGKRTMPCHAPMLGALTRQRQLFRNIARAELHCSLLHCRKASEQGAKDTGRLLTTKRSAANSEGPQSMCPSYVPLSIWCSICRSLSEYECFGYPDSSACTRTPAPIHYAGRPENHHATQVPRFVQNPEANWGPKSRHKPVQVGSQASPF